MLRTRCRSSPGAAPGPARAPSRLPRGVSCDHATASSLLPSPGSNLRGAVDGFAGAGCGLADLDDRGVGERVGCAVPPARDHLQRGGRRSPSAASHPTPSASAAVGGERKRSSSTRSVSLTRTAVAGEEVRGADPGEVDHARLDALGLAIDVLGRVTGRHCEGGSARARIATSAERAWSTRARGRKCSAMTWFSWLRPERSTSFGPSVAAVVEPSLISSIAIRTPNMPSRSRSACAHFDGQVARVEVAELLGGQQHRVEFGFIARGECAQRGRFVFAQRQAGFSEQARHRHDGRAQRAYRRVAAVALGDAPGRVHGVEAAGADLVGARAALPPRSPATRPRPTGP